MDRVQLLHIFHRTAPRCQREVQTLLQASLVPPAGAHSVPVCVRQGRRQGGGRPIRPSQ